MRTSCVPRKHLVILPLLLLLSILSTGCWTVAGAVVGGAILAAGGHVLDNTAEDTVELSVADAEAATRRALHELDLQIIQTRPTSEDGRIMRWDFETGTVGDRIVAVDVSLAEVSAGLTRVTVKAEKGWLSPDPATARTVIECIMRNSGARLARDTLHNTDDNGG